MKCIKCKQVFLSEVKKLSKTKEQLFTKTCPGCRILPARSSKKSMREKKK